MVAHRQFSRLPKDVYPLVACVTAGVGFLVYSSVRTLLYSGEVHLYNETRQDELQENPIIKAKGEKMAERTGFYHKLSAGWGQPTLFDPAWTRPTPREDA